MKLCGAKTRAGTPCTRAAMPNGRCHLHGGKAKGPPKGSQNALKHGVFSSVVRPGEEDIFEGASVDGLDDLIRMTTLQLVRAYQGYNRQVDNPDGQEDFAMAERKTKEREVDMDEGQFAMQTEETVTKKRPDFLAYIDKLTGRLTNLHLARAQISGDSRTTDEVAEEIKKDIQAMGLKTTGTLPGVLARQQKGEANANGD